MTLLYKSFTSTQRLSIIFVRSKQFLTKVTGKGYLSEISEQIGWLAEKNRRTGNISKAEAYSCFFGKQPTSVYHKKCW